MTWLIGSDDKLLLRYVRCYPYSRRRTRQRSMHSLWDDADDVVTSELTYVEAAAALAKAKLLGRFTAGSASAELRQFDQLWREFSVCHVDSHVIAARCGAS